MSQSEKLRGSSKRIKTIFREDYAALIKELISTRKSLDLSQTDVAIKMGWKDHTYLSKIETREKRLDVVELAQLSKIYGKLPEDFMKLLKI